MLPWITPSGFASLCSSEGLIGFFFKHLILEVVPLELEHNQPTDQAHGNEEPEQGSRAENFTSHGVIMEISPPLCLAVGSTGA